MNKLQRKKSVMRNISKLYNEIFENGRFNKDAAIIAGVDPRGQRMLTTVFITSYQYEFTTDAIFGVTLEGYLTDREVIKR